MIRCQSNTRAGAARHKSTLGNGARARLSTAAREPEKHFRYDGRIVFRKTTLPSSRVFVRRRACTPDGVNTSEIVS